MTLGLLGDDLPLAILATGLAGLALAAGSRRRAVALAAAWLPYAALTVVIWEGRVSDALLAVKLPVVMAAGVGWALIVGRLSRPPWPALAGGSAAIALALALTATAADNRGRVLAVTRDRSLEPVVDRVAGAVGAAKDPGRVTVMAPWGHVYWALAYAAEYRGVLAGARVVDHNADVGGLVHPGAVLVTPAETLYVFPPEWWSQRVEGMVLESYGPDMVRVGRRGEHHDSLPAPEPLADGPQPVNSAIDIVAARGAWFDPSRVHVVVHWRAKRRPAADYSVAVHLLAADPPTGSPVVLAQADAAAPVSGWWPTSRWRPGDVVRDDYLVAVPDGSRPRDVRITLYRRLPDGGFENGEWLTVPVPPEEDS
ncbi:MAG: hypothetical protein ACE5EL_02145, partial [Anaerolineae bacterium]